MTGGRVEDIYAQLKQMAVAFRIKPGDRLNEGSLAQEMGVSRTPLREALNRLVAERLVDFRPGAGFFCRALEPQVIFDLYELRRILETEAVRLCCARAAQGDLEALRDDLLARGMEVSGLTIAEACARDEEFHLGIAKLSGNAELVVQLERINDRIRFVRWVQMSPEAVPRSKEEHRKIMVALMRREADRAAGLMGDHIARRLDQITETVGRGIANIYMNTGDDIAERILEEQTP